MDTILPETEINYVHTNVNLMCKNSFNFCSFKLKVELWFARGTNDVPKYFTEIMKSKNVNCKNIYKCFYLFFT